MALQTRSHRFTVEEYHRLGDAGVLHPDTRVELIDGLIVDVSPISSRHQACVDRLNDLLVERVRGRARLRVQGPVALGLRDEPEPDLAVLRWRADYYVDAHPGAPDILLVIEVSDSSSRFDRRVKLPRYARAGVPAVWIVDLAADEILVARDPDPPAYRTVEVLQRGARVDPPSVPGLSLSVDEILGPPR
jgi:Uma2 family endonuclease